MTAAAMNSGFVRPSGPAFRNPSASSAAEISAAHVGYRSAGSFAIAREMTLSIASGNPVLRRLARGGSSSRCAHATARRDSRGKTVSPVRHSYSRQPSE